MSTHEGRTSTVVDPVVALGDKLAELDRLWRRIDDDCERLEAMLTGDHPGRNTSTFVMVGERRCNSPQEIHRCAEELGIDAGPLVSRWYAIDEQRRATRKRLGLEQLDAAEAMARTGYQEIRKKIARTQATSPEGIAVKVRILAEGLREGLSGDEVEIAESALSDLLVNRSKFIRLA